MFMRAIFQTEKSVDQMLAFWDAARQHKHVIATRTVIDGEEILVLSDKVPSDEDIAQFMKQQEASIRGDGSGSVCENCGAPADYHSEVILCPACL